MKYINKMSHNQTEAQVQNYYHSLGYQSLKRGWPDFCFYKNRRKGKGEYIFVEVKRKNQNSIKVCQRNIKNIFTELGLTYKVAFGLKEDGTPNFKDNLPGINK
jgi:hypothetical protein